MRGATGVAVIREKVAVNTRLLLESQEEQSQLPQGRNLKSSSSRLGAHQDRATTTNGLKSLTRHVSVWQMAEEFKTDLMSGEESNTF